MDLDWESWGLRKSQKVMRDGSTKECHGILYMLCVMST